MIKVSIIIPVYNRQNLIEECIRSVQRQTMGDLEILCVDDGSTDNSCDIIRWLSGNDNRIRLVKSEHKGPGNARNIGISYAQGKYVCFLDSDDYYYEEDSLDCLFNTCEKEGVYACCGHIFERDINGELHFVMGDANHTKEIAEQRKMLFFSEEQNCFGYTSFIFLRKMLFWEENHYVLCRRSTG